MQLQFHAGGAKHFDACSRATADRGGRPSTEVAIAGASAALEEPSTGLLGMVVGDEYVQLSVIGGTAHEDDPAQLADRIVAELR